MKTLVTGGAGFIASHFTDAYIAEGHDVASLDDLPRGSMSNVNPRARLYKGDIRDRDFVQHVFSRERPNAVNHRAAQIDVRHGVREPVFDASVNILGSITLLEAAVAHKDGTDLSGNLKGAKAARPGAPLFYRRRCSPDDSVLPAGLSPGKTSVYMKRLPAQCAPKSGSPASVLPPSSPGATLSPKGPPFLRRPLISFASILRLDIQRTSFPCQKPAV